LTRNENIMNELQKKTLNPKEQLFCSNYCAIGTPTFCRTEKSAIAAGYSEKSARNSATALLKRPEIQERISELNKENLSRNNVTVDKVLTDLEHTRLLAIEKGELSTATRCSELQGKYLVMFSDKHVFSPSEQQQLTAEQREKALELKDDFEAMINAKYNGLTLDFSDKKLIENVNKEGVSPRDPPRHDIYIQPSDTTE